VWGRVGREGAMKGASGSEIVRPDPTCQTCTPPFSAPHAQEPPPFLAIFFSPSPW